MNVASILKRRGRRKNKGPVVPQLGTSQLVTQDGLQVWKNIHLLSPWGNQGEHRVGRATGHPLWPAEPRPFPTVV